MELPFKRGSRSNKNTAWVTLMALILMGIGVFPALAEDATPGTLDPTFGTGGVVSTNITGVARDMVILGDGKILVAGETGNGWVGDADFVLARFHPNGRLDTSFGNEGKVLTDFSGVPSTSAFKTEVSNDNARSLLVQPDGKILVMGYHGNNSDAWALARYHSNGSLDTSFGTGGKILEAVTGTYDYGYDVDLLPDGKILMSGTMGYDFGVMRLNADGSVDTSFGKDGKFKKQFTLLIDTYTQLREYVYDLQVQPDGKLIIGGNTITYGGSSSFAMMRLNANGTLDTSFGTGGQVMTPTPTFSVIYKMVVLPNGDILAAGDACHNMCMALLKYKSDGSLDTTFGENGISTAAFPKNGRLLPITEAWGMAIQSNGKIILGGHTFELTDAGEDKGWCFTLARFHPDGSLDTTFGTRGDGMVRTDVNLNDDLIYEIALLPNGDIIAAGSSGPSPTPRETHIALARYKGDRPANNAPILGSPTALPNPANAGDQVSFSASATDADGDTLSYQWNFGDGKTGLGASTTHTYTSANLYSVRVAVTDGKGGSDSALISLSIAAVNGVPTLESSPTATPNPAAVNEWVTFHASATDVDGDHLTYTWNFDDGTAGSGTDPKHIFATPGTYTVTVNITDGKGGSVSGSVSVVVKDVTGPSLDTTSIVLNGTVADEGGISSLTVNGKATSVGNNGSWSARIPIITVTTTITVMATDNAGNSSAQNITINK